MKTCAIRKAINPPTIIAPKGITAEPVILFLIISASSSSKASSPLGTPKTTDSTDIIAWNTVESTRILQKDPKTGKRKTVGSSGRIGSMVWPIEDVIKNPDIDPKTKFPFKKKMLKFLRNLKLV